MTQSNDTTKLLRVTDVLGSQDASRFSFTHFNKVQTLCFESIYNSNDNLLISAPTSCGKTVLMELALLKAVKVESGARIVYIGPTKALCSEVFHSWTRKFADLKCFLFVGDQEATEELKQCRIIVTTPEKWESFTRQKQSDNSVSLLLLDEIHILNEDRGAYVEALVMRMHLGSLQPRIIAVSATVPNLDEIAQWINAKVLKFGPQYRPVPLQKVVIGYNYKSGSNSYAFDAFLNSQLPNILQKYSHGKSVLIFNATQKSSVTCASYLSKSFGEKWKSDCRDVASLEDKKLASCVKSGVGYHHAGLSPWDRQIIEQLLKDGSIKILCSTSTLAVGVNLPARLVIIKGTSKYNGTQMEEYSDLEIIQMMGRSGRQGLDSSGVVVIQTLAASRQKFLLLSEGSMPVQSRFLPEIPVFLMSEIASGNIYSQAQAWQWLQSSLYFLQASKCESPEEIQKQFDLILDTMLEQKQIIKMNDKFIDSHKGNIMAKYRLTDAMIKEIDALHCSDTLQLLVELLRIAIIGDLRYLQGEKSVLGKFYQDCQLCEDLKNAVPTFDIESNKILFLVLSKLSGTYFKHSNYKIGSNLDQQSFEVLRNLKRVVNGAIAYYKLKDCGQQLLNAIQLLQMIKSMSWNNLEYHLRQLSSVGHVLASKFISSGIQSLNDLPKMSSSHIEAICGRNPPFGTALLKNLNTLPFVSCNCQSDEQASKLRFNAQLINHSQDTIKKTKEGIVHFHCLIMSETGILCHKRLSISELITKEFTFEMDQGSSNNQVIKFHVINENFVGLDATVSFGESTLESPTAPMRSYEGLAYSTLRRDKPADEKSRYFVGKQSPKSEIARSSTSSSCHPVSLLSFRAISTPQSLVCAQSRSLVPDTNLKHDLNEDSLENGVNGKFQRDNLKKMRSILFDS
ncbi:hypothetical protein MIR68_001249 [Amoeboaphelidium protococcarum]|nr:hypothetical protein MIR68_001249 [Amoeboaphelidium protococcarum]